MGLARGREWGRLLGTYASGWWVVTIVFIPVSLGIAWVLSHRHLPERARHAVAQVTGVHGLVLSGFLAAAVIGVGRGFGWGRPLAASASGFLALSGYAFLCVAVALYLLYRDAAFSAAGPTPAPALAPTPAPPAS